MAVIIIPIIFNLVELIIIWICGSIDPGIMKKNENFGRGDDPPIKLIHKGVYKETKICSTCNIVKPFRSHHCNDCGNCIYRFDHHCPWIGGCVGGRNYIYFFLFLCLLNIKNIFLVIFGIIHIIYIFKDIKEEEKKIQNWVAIHLIGLIPTLLTIIFIGCTMIFTIGLNIYHIRLIINNITTKEEIKKLIYNILGNPYDKGCSKNCKDFWTKHKKYEDNFTVKELRNKCTIDENVNKENKNINVIKKKPLIMPYGYSKKERELLNKAKNINNDNNNEQKKEIDNKDNINIEIEKENISNKIKEEKDIKEKEEQIIGEKNNNISNQKSEEEGIFSISDENDDYKAKICNTSVKNKSNLNKIDNLELSQIENKNFFDNKKINLSKEDKGYLIAQKRLEELSSEITIHQENNDSMSIPNENSLNSSLSQAA